ncbi:hypothetical protein Peur_042621 [Populus x canadensis]
MKTSLVIVHKSINLGREMRRGRYQKYSDNAPVPCQKVQAMHLSLSPLHPYNLLLSSTSGL